MKPLRCLLGRHTWTDWGTHSPCTKGPHVIHHVRGCFRCNASQHRYETPCACPIDPNEYMHCPRWNRGDTACRPKEK